MERTDLNAFAMTESQGPMKNYETRTLCTSELLEMVCALFFIYRYTGTSIVLKPPLGYNFSISFLPKILI